MKNKWYVKHILGSHRLSRGREQSSHEFFPILGGCGHRIKQNKKSQLPREIINVLFCMMAVFMMIGKKQPIVSERKRDRADICEEKKLPRAAGISMCQTQGCCKNKIHVADSKRTEIAKQIVGKSNYYLRVDFDNPILVWNHSFAEASLRSGASYSRRFKIIRIFRCLSSREQLLMICFVMHYEKVVPISLQDW